MWFDLSTYTDFSKQQCLFQATVSLYSFTKYCNALEGILGVHGRTTNNMVCAELGRFILEIQIKKRMIGYWGRLIIGKELIYAN